MKDVKIRLKMTLKKSFLWLFPFNVGYVVANKKDSFGIFLTVTFSLIYCFIISFWLKGEEK